MGKIHWKSVELRNESQPMVWTFLEPMSAAGLRVLAEWRAAGRNEYWVIAPDQADAWEHAITFTEMEAAMLTVEQIDWTGFAEAVIEAEPRPAAVEELPARSRVVYAAALAAGWTRIEADDPDALELYEDSCCIGLRASTGVLAKLDASEYGGVAVGARRGGYIVWGDMTVDDATATVEWWQAAAAKHAARKVARGGPARDG